MRETASLDSRSAPMRSRAFPTFLVETPGACISATAQITARPTRLQRSTRPSGKWVPRRSFGILSVIVPTCVSSRLSRNPFLAVPVASHTASARAAIISLTPASSRARARPVRPAPPSSASPSVANASCGTVSIAVSVPLNPSLGRKRF